MSLLKDSGLQFGKVGESLEHIRSQAADPVVGQVTVNRKRQESWTAIQPDQDRVLHRVTIMVGTLGFVIWL